MLPAVRNVILTPNLITQAMQVLSRYQGSLWRPDTSTCFSDSSATMPAVKDGVVGAVRDSAFAGILATQATAGYKPILRRGAKNMLSNSSASGAVVGVIGSGGVLPTGWSISAGGLAREVVAIGTENGISYIDLKFSGTTSVTYGYIQFGTTSAVNTQTFTGAAHCAIQGGSIARITQMWFRSQIYDGTVPLTQQTDTSILASIPGALSAAYRPSATITSTLTGTIGARSRIELGWANGAAIDVTIRVGHPQLETGSVASPYAATTSAPASNGIGNWWLDFDGVDDRLSLSAVPFQMADDHCVIACFTPYATQEIIFAPAYTSSTARYAAIGMGSGGGEFVEWYDGTSYINKTTATATLGTAKVISARRSGSILNARKTGVEFNTPGTAFNTAVQGASASIGGGPLGYANCSGYAFIAIKGTVSDSDLRILERFAGMLGGVTI